uniref:NADH dehydrogenase subunit 4L n=1 Tax=Porphyridium aerugineum TaxID=2792 RepID=UPI001FCE256C|nr:NADH dehydrogenase subunit 4L [Porphyridium aerugineum]UNJ18825.1 NADH dehydrogenase subunit 4L [Porphyridium aerugineum]
MFYTMKFLFRLSLIIFVIGVTGIFQAHKNILVILRSIELRLVSATLNFINSSYILDDILGQIFAFIILTVAASESAIALAIFVVYFRIHNFLMLEVLNLVKG